MNASIPRDENLSARFQRIQRMAAAVGVIGLVLCLIEVFIDKDRFFQSYLFAFIFWNGLTLGSLGLYLLHNVVGGNWGVVIRRFLESGARTLPFTFILLLPILVFGIPTLYEWAKPEALKDANIQFKAGYLNITAFIVRALIYFAIWGFFMVRLTRLSVEQDNDRANYFEITQRMKKMSTYGLLIFVLCATFAFIDWIMSLEPHWYSTIYGAMFLVGQILETLAFCTALLILLSKYEPFARVIKHQHYHDLGNMMLAFTMLWAYTSFAQLLIIWAGNLPEEIPWYIRRFTGGWGWIGWFIGVFHFCVPFVLLLMRFIKKTGLLYYVALYMFFVRFIDIFWIVEPALRQRGLSVYWTDIVAPIGVGGIWIALFLWHLNARPLLPLHDPRLGYAPLESEV